MQTKNIIGLFLVITVFIVIAMCCCQKPADLVDRKTNITGNSNLSKTPTPLSTPESSPTPIPIDENSPDYKAGYAKGLRSGKELTKVNVPSGNLTPQMIQNIANIQAGDAKPQPKDVSAFRAGFVKGFNEAFQPKKISPNLEHLSWGNAKEGVKLYDSNGKQVATITAVDESAGMITVRYVGGEVENKYLEPLSKFWYVKK